MKKLKLILVFACLTLAAFAEQRVVIVTNYMKGNPPDLTEINTLLSQGWKVKQVETSGGGAATSGYLNIGFTYVFVLERGE